MSHLTAKFDKMGARVKVRDNITGGPVRVNILQDRGGEFFDLERGNPESEISVLDIQPDDRHLLLLVRTPESIPF